MCPVRDHQIGQAQGQARSDHGIRAVGDVGERSAVDERRRPLERLDEVWLHGLLEEGGHGARGLYLERKDGLSVLPVAYDDVAKSLFELLQVGRKTEDGHDL
jgi:hypothetical protein